MGANGESIGAFHSVRTAWRHPSKYDVYVKYMNHDKHPCFPAKNAVYNEELDLLIATLLPPFQFHSPKFLQPASGVSVGDTVHCLGFPKLIDEEIRLQIQEFTGDDKSPSPSVPHFGCSLVAMWVLISKLLVNLSVVNLQVA